MNLRSVARLAAVALLFAGCADDPSPVQASRPLTDDEAALLADVLFQNVDLQGATFQLAVQIAPGATINLQGDVDWVEHRGHASVVGRGVEQGVQEVFWSDDTVLEKRNDLNAALAQAGMGSVSFVARDPDIEGRALDQTLAVVTGLSAKQRDNPLLIEQTEGSAFLRTDTLRGIDVVVLRYGLRAVYWLSADDGRLVRFESDNAAGTSPLVFDVFEFGERTIDGPDVSQVIDVADIQDIYDDIAAPTPAPG